MASVSIVIKSTGAAAAATDIKSVGNAADDAAPKIGKAGNEIEGVGKASSGASGPLGSLGSALSSVGKIAAGFVIGKAITELPGFLISAAQGAADDAAATDRLNQALKNVGGGFDTNIAKVNERIAAGQNLVFGDDDIRDSFQSLLAATGSVDEALLRQTAAMDLARGAGIPLSQATKMLGKLNAENIEVFKKLGITLGENATEMDALGAVQAKFGGQAAVYAESEAGRFEKLKIRLGEAKEAIGAGLLPVMGALLGAAEKAAPFVETLAGKLAALGGIAFDQLVSAFQAIAPAAQQIAGVAWDGIIAVAGLAWDGIKSAFEVIGPAAQAIAGLAWDALTAVASAAWGEMAQAWEKIGPAITGAAGPAAEFAESNKLLVASFLAGGPVMAAVVLAFQNWGAVMQFLEPTLSKLGDAFNVVASAAGPLLGILTPMVGLWRELGGSILASAVGHFRAMAPAMLELYAAVGQLIAALAPLEPVIKPIAIALGVVLAAQFIVAAGAVTGLLVVLDQLIPVFTTVLVGAITTATAAIETVTPAVAAMAAGIGAAVGPIGVALVAIGLAFETAGKEVGAFLSGTWNTVKEKLITPIAEAAVEIATKGTALITGFTGAISQGLGALWTTINGLVTTLKGAFDGASGWLVDAGKAMIQGLINGIGSMLGAAKEAAVGVITSAIGAAKAAAGIKSPSTVMHEEVGVPLIEGIAEGIIAAAPMAIAAAAAVTQAVIDTSQGYIYTPYEARITGTPAGDFQDAQFGMLAMDARRYDENGVYNNPAMQSMTAEQIAAANSGYAVGSLGYRQVSAASGHGNTKTGSGAVFSPVLQPYQRGEAYANAPSPAGNITVNVNVAGSVNGIDDLTKAIDQGLKRAGQAGLLR